MLEQKTENIFQTPQGTVLRKRHICESQCQSSLSIVESGLPCKFVLKNVQTWNINKEKSI